MIIRKKESGTEINMPHDVSIRGMTIEECRALAKVMGYSENALDHYCGRFVRIKIRGVRYRGSKFATGREKKQRDSVLEDSIR